MNSSSIFYPLVLLFCIASFCIASTGDARPVAWGSAFQDKLFDASGAPLSSAFSFEIGTFEAGFTPTLGNVHDWDANWMVFDRAFDPDGSGWNSLLQFFTGFASHQPDGTSDSPDALGTDVFIQDAQVYLWAYDSKTVDLTTQWALVTDANPGTNAYDGWKIPDPADASPDTISWQLEDADTAVIGGVQGTQFAGDFDATPPEFSLQTAFLQVPEPGSAALVLVAATAFLGRRRLTSPHR